MHLYISKEDRGRRVRVCESIIEELLGTIISGIMMTIYNMKVSPLGRTLTELSGENFVKVEQWKRSQMMAS